MSRVILRAENINMRFGGVLAVAGFSVDIHEHKITALIGPNGAGKTTAFNIISGIYTPTSGKVIFSKDENTNINLVGKTPDKITKLGMARTFQNIRLFKELSVFDNVLIAKHVHAKANFLESALRLPRSFREEKIMVAQTQEILERFDLQDVAEDKAASLPYGQQRRLEIARALATNPQLLLLDEPAAGMNPQETLELTSFIRQIKEEFNLSIFLIEHHMDLVMEISDTIYVVEFGEMIAQGTASEIQNNQKVIEAYLGASDA
ncbi:MAG: ABC transporter ATP-binding protein [Treponemataceae bacterium]